MSDPSGEPISLIAIGLVAVALFTAAFIAGARGKTWLRLVLVIGVPSAVILLGLANTYLSYPEPCDGCIVSPRAEPFVFTVLAGIGSFLVAGFGVLAGLFTDHIAR